MIKMTVETAPPIQTKWGTAKVGNTGYYTISENSKGHYGELLHRLLFEDFYKISLHEEFPEWVIIHHVDGNKLNNKIWNLDLMSREEHGRIHATGRKLSESAKQKLKKFRKGFKHTEETKNRISELKKGERLSETTKLKMSSNKNTSGFYCVSTKPCPKCSIGFSWVYQYYDENMKHKVIHSVNLLKLKKRVLKKALPWKVIDINNAKTVCEKFGYDLGDLI